MKSKARPKMKFKARTMLRLPLGVITKGMVIIKNYRKIASD
jgi:hypothetical protein